jgi:hypothetical protein
LGTHAHLPTVFLHWKLHPLSHSGCSSLPWRDAPKVSKGCHRIKENMHTMRFCVFLTFSDRQSLVDAQFSDQQGLFYTNTRPETDGINTTTGVQYHSNGFNWQFSFGTWHFLQHFGAFSLNTLEPWWIIFSIT